MEGEKEGREGGREKRKRGGREGGRREEGEREKFISILLSIKMISDLSGVKVRPSQHVL